MGADNPALGAEIRRRALALLARSDLSSSELCTRLERKGFPPDLVVVEVEMLAAKGLVNDRRRAEVLVRRGARRGLGRSRIRRELQERGLDPELTQQVLDSPELESDATRALELAHKARRQGKTEIQAWRYLAGRGFGGAESRAAVKTAYAEPGLEF